MSSPRPATLLNLGDFVREEISPSPPVYIHRSSRKSSKPISSTAPTKRQDYWSSSESSRGYSASLVGPVMDETQVLSTSATSINSSGMLRHQEAANIGPYGSTVQSQGGAGAGMGKSVNVNQPINFEDEFEKIQMRNEAKRSDHSTT